MITVDDLIEAKDYMGQSVSYIQKKMDGMRLLVTRKLEGGIIQAQTRWDKNDFGRLVDHTPGIKEQISQLQKGTQIDCELWAPGVPATSIITLLKAMDPRLKLTPFACPTWCGLDAREEYWSSMCVKLKGIGFTPVESEYFDQVSTLSFDIWSQRAEALGIEGWVAKYSHYHGWYKIKPVKVVDCVVMSTTKSDSMSFFGMLKAVQVGVYKEGKLVQIASVSSGFSAQDRQELGQKRDSLIGRVCMVKYDSVAAQGQLRFPRFVAWRDDKPATQCLHDQLPAALKAPDVDQPA